MVAVPSSMTIADYCHAMERRDITVNRDYQRSDKIWPAIARSFLIETILLGLPIPKIYLFQITDLKSKKTVEEIVDGQQRSMAILDFFQDKLRLSKNIETEELQSRCFSELSNEFKKAFLSYSLTTDKLVGVNRDDVREIFRRMNSYTIPLNPEEQRHAGFQGRFKWFSYRMARKFDQRFIDLGLFSEKDVVRMADTKLLAEICHALLNGIQTTKRKQLDDLYDQNDEKFPQEKSLEDRITQALDIVCSWDALRNTELVRAHVFYAVVLAVLHLKFKYSELNKDFRIGKPVRINEKTDIRPLLVLSNAIESNAIKGKFKTFVLASSEKTNVREQRQKRFQWCCSALTGNLP